jgi:hypothetical protein
MVQIIPDGSNADDKITIGFGAWSGVGANALDGNDTFHASLDRFTLGAGAGNDRITALDATALVHLGTGNDTASFTGAAATLDAGTRQQGK